MKKIAVNKLVQASHAVGILIGMRNGLDAANQGAQTVALTPEARRSCLDRLRPLQLELQVLGAGMTKKSVDRFVRALEGKENLHYSDLDSWSKEISSRLIDELSVKHVYVMDDQEAALFVEPGFGAEVAAKFPVAVYDIEEAGKCLALGRSTAAVFHLMRAMEFALRAVHTSLSISAPKTPNEWNWGTITHRIHDEIRRRGKGFDEAKSFHEFYALLDAVKTAWRNDTMHAGEKKTPEEAAAIYAAVKGFMGRVAARMDENGTPLAQ